MKVDMNTTFGKVVGQDDELEDTTAPEMVLILNERDGKCCFRCKFRHCVHFIGICIHSAVHEYLH